MADTWHGPYTVIGNPHPGDPTNTSFHSQISSVFRVPGKKDLYIACADRWQPAYQHLPYEVYARLFESWFNPEMERLSADSIPGFPHDSKANTAMADYVWLPLRFTEEGGVRIDWKDHWSPAEYD